MQWKTIEGSEKGSNINLSYILKDIENELCWWWWLRLGDSYGEKLHVLLLLESYSWYSLLMFGMWKIKQIDKSGVKPRFLIWIKGGQWYPSLPLPHHHLPLRYWRNYMPSKICNPHHRFTDKTICFYCSISHNLSVTLHYSGETTSSFTQCATMW